MSEIINAIGNLFRRKGKSQEGGKANLPVIEQKNPTDEDVMEIDTPGGKITLDVKLEPPRERDLSHLNP